jgi:putative transposase
VFPYCFLHGRSATIGQMDVAEIFAVPQRKRVRHYDLPGDAHFLTFSCFRRLPLLSKDRTRMWLVDAIGKAQTRHKFELWAWVIMPEHVHLLINPRATGYSISAILSSIKRPVAQAAIAYLACRRSPFLTKLTISTRARTYRRFWQAGPGQDHNIHDPVTAHKIVEYIHNNPVKRGLVARSDDWR